MEYEIASEDRLFDPSTNPSLDHHAHPPERKPARTAGDRPHYEARKRQKAELIPEEEEQQS